VKAWRIVKMRHQNTAFDGEGARRYGGRFNRRGQRAVYASEHQSLAALETLVHTGLQERQLRYVKFELDIPNEIVHTVPLADLPDGWDMTPLIPEVQAWGNKQLTRYGVLCAASAIIPDESNIVMAQDHAVFERIRIGKPTPFHWDPRLRS
jgi:RES domain-containing protein